MEIAGIFNNHIKWFRFYLVEVSDLFLLYGCQIQPRRPVPALFPSGRGRRDGGASGTTPLPGMHISMIIILNFSFIRVKFIMTSRILYIVV